MQNLVLWSRIGRPSGGCHQTSCLATAAPNCDHIATMPHVTGRAQCPTRTTPMAAEQERWVSEGIRRAARDGRCMTTDLAVGGFESLAARHHHRSSAALSRGRWLVLGAPDCDHVGGQCLSDCDHLRPQLAICLIESYPCRPTPLRGTVRSGRHGCWRRQPDWCGGWLWAGRLGRAAARPRADALRYRLDR
jgi:hypothetical protein